MTGRQHEEKENGGLLQGEASLDDVIPSLSESRRDETQKEKTRLRHHTEVVLGNRRRIPWGPSTKHSECLPKLSLMETLELCPLASVPPGAFAPLQLCLLWVQAMGAPRTSQKTLGQKAEGATPSMHGRRLFSSVGQSCLTLCNPMDCSMPGFPVHDQLLEFTQTHVRWVGDAVQSSHPLSSPSPPAFNLSQNQGLFKWVSSLHQVAKVSEFQLQHQSFQWTPSTDLL